jgi:starch phosphorylase
MSTRSREPSPASPGADGMADFLRQYGCGPVELTGTDNALYERHLFFDNVVKLTDAGPRERFEAFARAVWDILSQRWVLTEDTYRREAKAQFADWLQSTSGQTVDPDTIFDCQVKRIHEYKRQLLNALRIVVLYNRLRENPNIAMTPRTFCFAGKAAPACQLAKLIIKFINNLAGTLDGDPSARGRLKVVFLPEYDVSLAERLIPASDVSNQISTAGYEASGTSNMKFMMNGALTLGTRDGATIEMAEEAGEENFFLFGLTAAQVADSHGWYDPRWHYDHEPETRAALDLIFADHFSRYEPSVFAPLRDTLLTPGDHYRHLADLRSYLEADQRLGELYTDAEGWARKAILNVAGSGKFSSDRTIAEYAADIWNVKPCPVP